MEIMLKLSGSASAIAAFLSTVPAALLGDPGAAAAPAPGPAPVMPSAIPPMPNLSGSDDDDGPANGNAPATDVSGLPWDERIHAKTKGTNEDGTWRKRRGVDASVVAAVENELRNAGAQPLAMPVGVPLAPPAPLPVMQMPPQQPQMMPMPMPAPVPLPVPVAVAPPPPPPAPAAEGIDFTGFMAHLTTKMQTGAVTTDDLVALVQQINAAYAPQGGAPLGAITDLQSDPGKLQYAVQVMQHNGKW